jgi:hypothetical protein
MAAADQGAPPIPKPQLLKGLKSKLLRPALTSHYICGFNPVGTAKIGAVDKWLSGRSGAGFAGEDYKSNTDLFQLSCCEASLPGSTLMTNDITDDYHGVSQKHAYRRLYDDRADFTFYVDNNYKIVSFFEGWLAYIVGEDDNGGKLGNLDYSYRVRFPETYKTDGLYITKFERDSGTKNAGQRVLQYHFKQAYPISINSMPVSYDQSQLLKCTVSFTYERYILTKSAGYVGTQEPKPRTATGVPVSQSDTVTLYGPRSTDIPRNVQIDPNRPTLAQIYNNI